MNDDPTYVVPVPRMKPREKNNDGSPNGMEPEITPNSFLQLY